MQLAQVVSTGSSGYFMVLGVTEAQISEFTLLTKVVHGHRSRIGE